VGSSSFDENIFNRGGIVDMLQRHYSRQADHSVLLGILATWSVALTYFVYDKVDSCPVAAEPYAN
jgi:hypothetical protein